MSAPPKSPMRSGCCSGRRSRSIGRLLSAVPTTFDDADNQLREMILRDRNRASVITWGVGNENADTDDRLEFMRRLTVSARDLDPSRLIAAACLVNPKAKKVEDRPRRLFGSGRHQ